MIWIEFAVSALVTAATYGTGPMLLALLRKKPLRVRYLRIFSIVYTITVWAAWQFLTYDGNSVRTMPALFWGYVFYRLARGILEKKTVSLIPQQVQSKERCYTCPKCGRIVPDGEMCDCEKVPPNPKIEAHAVPSAQVDQPPPITKAEQSERKKVPRWFPSCIISALLVVCTCILGYRISVLTTTLDDLAAECETLSRENDILNTSIDDLSEKNKQLQEVVDDLDAQNENLFDYFCDTSFFTANIGFIVNGSNRYHSYDCAVVQLASTYWAHNVEYCEYLGYTKCGNCW